MNENLDLREKLKDYPKGAEFWSDVFGTLYFEDIDYNGIYPLVFKDENSYKRLFTESGTYVSQKDYPDARCAVFPSKENRDWSKLPTLKNYKVFSPFSKVLVRDMVTGTWETALYSRYDKVAEKHRVTDGYWYEDKNILLYKGNENKLGKE